ncbi:hypothetical protein [Nannocystis bainbridge]|uniref:Uncharacterized protein n=1 Tax=Nannocystis bainbridge TaxID=2995303 RepID=A0ABT5EFE5_9BACT|nr:hypothetical protein [Nannocystis bainbridge]MDC0723571.1 hypothetical protein [Nannocystis bainbridge]
MPPAAPTATDRLAAIEQRVVARIHDFEVGALLDLLASIGYGPGELEFRAHPSNGPQPALLHAIAFPDPHARALGRARVVITVNLGLLSCRSPLPTYFRRLLQDMETRDPVLELIGVLDRSLLHTRLTSDRPERMLAGWDRVRRDLVQVFGLDSPIGLTWLFRQIFPELALHVRRIFDEHPIPYDGAVLGTSELGECSFGEYARVGVHDMEVTLFCEDALYRERIPWIHEGDRRLRSSVFPLLDEVCLTLTVVFVLLRHGEGARLGPPGRAGHNPMWRPGTAPALPPSRVEVYRGTLPRNEPDTDHLERILADELPASLTVLPAPSPAHETLGHAIALSLVHRAPGERPHTYHVTVRWGSRAWDLDEPHAIDLRCDDVPKTPLSRIAHPRLWAKLRDAARASIPRDI